MVQIDEMLHDGQPQAGSSGTAGPRFVHPVKTLENARQIFFRDADPRIADDDANLLVFPAFAQNCDIDADSAAFLRVTDRIGQQVHENLPQPVFIPFHKQVVGNVVGHGNRLLLGRGQQHLVDAVEQFLQVYGSVFERHELGFDFGQVENVADQAVQPVPFIVDDLQERTGRLLVFDASGEQCFGKAFDRGDRRF